MLGSFPWKINTNAFQKILKESNRRQSQSEGCKPNKIWIDKGSEFYNSSMKTLCCYWKIYQTLKTEIYKCMISISKNVYIDILKGTVNEYNNT